MTRSSKKTVAKAKPIPRCSSCGSSQKHHVEYVRKTGKCVI